jgi:hypothetical protein
MSKRKNLKDVIHKNGGQPRATAKASDSWEAFEAHQQKKGGKVYDLAQATKAAGRCYESHPPLTLPGSVLVVFGGSCSSPVVKDADIYIGFDPSMRFTERRYPWKKGDEVLFTIPDMGIPAKPEEFAKLIRWTKKQLEQGAKVHAGCIGGHGRTGAFLSALVREFGEKDAINYVRQHYCQRAVESSMQVNFLVEQFGIVKAKGAKSGDYSTGASTGKSHGGRGAELFAPLKANGPIWGG